MNDVLVRRATSDDLHAICGLGQVVNAMHHDAWPDFFAPPSDPSRDAAHWRASVDGDRAAAFVAIAGAAVVGFVTVGWTDETSPLQQRHRLARVNTLCVDAAWRRRGIARMLMARAEQWAVDVGALELRLNVWSFNRPAHAFYTTLGYGERSSSLGKRLSRADPHRASTPGRSS